MSTTGWHHTDESKSKISTSLKGRKRPHDVMEKTRLKNIGQTRTPEQRARMSAAHKGKPSHPMSPETREMLMKINIGKIVSQETRERMSQSQKGRVVSDETKLKISKSTKGRTGKKHSLESRAKMSVSKMGKPSPMKGIPMSLESRQRMSIAKKGKPNLSKRGEKNPNWNGVRRMGNIAQNSTNDLNPVLESTKITLAKYVVLFGHPGAEKDDIRYTTFITTKEHVVQKHQVENSKLIFGARRSLLKEIQINSY